MMSRYLFILAFSLFLFACSSGSNNSATKLYQCVPAGCNFNNNGISIYSTSANIAGDSESIESYCSGNAFLLANAYSYNLPSYIAPAVTVNNPGVCNGKPCGPDVILDRFNDQYTDINSDLLNIVNEGYSAFWVLPVQKSNNVLYPNGQFAWYSQYQAVDYGNINNYYGTENDLATLIKNTHKNGLKILLDISFHQMAAPSNLDSNGNFSFLQSSNGPISAITLNGNTNTGGADFANPKSDCWYGPLPGPQNGNSVCGSGTPSTNVLNLFTQFAELALNSNYLDADGFRIDELNINSSGIGTTLMTDILNNSAVNTNSKRFFGEYPSNSASNYIELESISVGNGNAANNGHMEMLNFPFLYDIRTAFTTNTGFTNLITQFNSSNIGGVPANSAINMAMDQDTVPDALHHRDMCLGWGLDYTKASLAYALILAIDGGTPFIFADGGSKVNTNQFNSGNKSVDYQNVTEVKAGIYFHNITQDKAMQIVYTTTDVLGLMRGNNYFFLENKGSVPAYFIYNNLRLTNFQDGSYVDLISGELMNIKNNKILGVLYLPAQSAMFFVPYKPK